MGGARLSALTIDAPEAAAALRARGATVIEGDDVNLMLAHWGHLDILVTRDAAQAAEAARHMRGRGRGTIVWLCEGPLPAAGVRVAHSVEEVA